MRRSRLALSTLVVAPLLIVAGPSALAKAAPSQVTVPLAHASVPASLYAAAAKTGTTPVIVLLRGGAGVSQPDTKANHARHASALAAEESPVASLLTSRHAAKVHRYAAFGEISATVDAATLTALSASPDVASVVPDSTIKVTDPTASLRTALGAAGATSAAAIPTSSTKLPAGICSTNPAKPQLNPEALQTTHTDSDDPTAKTARSLGATGAGVKVAYFAEGIDVNNPDFIRPDGSKVFIDYEDFSGDGTAAPTSGGEAFLDASSIAAQGAVVYNTKKYTALEPSRPCYIRIEGIAPGASLVGLKVFGNAVITTSGLLQAVDYAVDTDHVDILSQSLGSNDYPDTANDAFRQADAAAVAAGVTVVASTGDAGVTSTIGSPATQPGVIGAGASTTYRSFLQSGVGEMRFPGVTGYVSNNISSLSSAGTDQAGSTVSLVAPGELNWDVCTPDPDQYADCTSYLGKPSAIGLSGGTSEAAPLIAGGAALVIEAYRQTHGGASPTPAQVQEVLLSTADDISAPADQQGTGELDTYRAVLAARALPGATVAPTGNTFVSDTGQIDAAAAPGTTVSKTVTVTNTGASSQTIHASQRTLGAYSSIAKTSVTLSSSSPTILSPTGLEDPYAVTHFTVPAHADRLDTSIAFVGESASLLSRGYLTLVDPLGRVAGYSLPQGVGNYGDSQVANPAAGVWTAYIYTRPASIGGSLTTYVFGARVADYESTGSVSPAALTLAPGASGSFAVSDQTPSSPGDQADSVVLSSAKAGVPTTIPVILRSLATTSGSASTFGGTLTGGNGRAASTGQTAYYEITVPQGTPALNANVTLADNPDNPFFISLVDPHGDSLGNATNLFEDATGTVTPEIGATSHVLAPAPGVWDLVVAFAPTVSGTALSEPFTVSIDGVLHPATATGLPQSTSTTLPAGATQVVKIKVKNTSDEPEEYFVDARHDYQNNYALVPLFGSSLTLPDAAYFDLYQVPSDSTQLAESLTSSVPVQFDSSAPTGDPDVEATPSGNGASLDYQAPGIEPGYWAQFASEVGPYGAVGAPQVSATAAGAVRTLAFDSHVSSPTGDLWLAGIGGSTSLAPVVVQPGHTGTLTVNITPTGKAGTAITGTLFVDDLQLPSVYGDAQPQADQETALPYSYTIG